MHAAGEAPTYSSGDERGRWSAAARLHTSGPRSAGQAKCAVVYVRVRAERMDGAICQRLGTVRSTVRGVGTLRPDLFRTVPELFPDGTLRNRPVPNSLRNSSITLRNSSDDPLVSSSQSLNFFLLGTASHTEHCPYLLGRWVDDGVSAKVLR